VQKFEGNPEHLARAPQLRQSPATLNQVTDPDRILYPLKRAGKRGQANGNKSPGMKCSTILPREYAMRLLKIAGMKSCITLVAPAKMVLPNVSSQLGA